MKNEYPPCKKACPILTDAREYVQLIGERRFEEALVAIRRQNPLPRVCGRVCMHWCETACKRGDVDEPIAIAALKRFAADGSWKDAVKGTSAKAPSGYKVAVIGSGPAGLSAAYHMAMLGHQVTIFEQLPFAGGMMAVGMPAFRMPRDVLAAEIKAIEDIGVKVQTGVTFGKDVTLDSLRADGYQAFFLATGLHLSRKLDVEGEDVPGVLKGVEFLRDVALGRPVPIGKKVIVIGGGNVAIDVARTALRMGAEDVLVVCLETQEEMPASDSEIEEAREEGVAIVNCFGPKRFLEKDGKLAGIEFTFCSCVFDEKGAFCPRYDDTKLRVIEADTAIVAIGQAADLSFADKEGVSVTAKRYLEADPVTLQTPIEGVFAGGDVFLGPLTVTDAIATGQQAAIAIDCYLRGEPLPTRKLREVPQRPTLDSAVREKIRRFSRSEPANLPVDQRLRSFDEVASVLSEELAIKEALRCLHCYLGARVDREKCVSCLSCVRICPLGIPTAGSKGEVTIDPVACQACGMCAVECPVQAIHMDLDPHPEIARQIEDALGKSQQPEPVIIGFFDLHGNFSSRDIEILRRDFPNILPVMIFGLGRVHPGDILKAFEYGAGGVILARCPVEVDPFPGARESIEQRFNHIKTILQAVGLDEGCLKICDMLDRGLVGKGVITELIQRIQSVGEVRSE
jgi:NADPH-dependent glutamate synthase beta subunit-like oxidoreductase/ferredoxin